jgi:hypothetical protein
LAEAEWCGLFFWVSQKKSLYFLSSKIDNAPLASADDCRITNGQATSLLGEHGESVFSSFFRSFLCTLTPPPKFT